MLRWRGAVVQGGPGTFSPLTTTGLFTQAAEDGLTANAGGTQAAALALSATKNLHRISVCATAGDSVALPAALAGQVHYIRNDGAAACQVYGTTPDTINGIATATGISLPSGGGAWFVCTTAAAWTTSPGAGQYLANTSTDAAPAYSFGIDPDTGMYRVGANDLGFSVNGVLGLRVQTGGVTVTVGSFNASAGSVSAGTVLVAGTRMNNASFTVGTLPSAATAGGQIYVSDAGGNGPCIALTNATNWKRCDNTSTTVT